MDDILVLHKLIIIIIESSLKYSEMMGNKKISRMKNMSKLQKYHTKATTNSFLSNEKCVLIFFVYVTFL